MKKHVGVILADDLTGALDSGVKLVHSGYHVQVITSEGSLAERDEEAEILVIDTETRHLEGKEAYEKVKKITQEAWSLSVEWIYKKTDSALRGNIGAELTAVMDASGEKKLLFVPAYPELGRTTLNGIQYVNGIRLSESVFAREVNDPSGNGEITSIIHAETDTPVYLYEGEVKEGIGVYDAVSEEDLDRAYRAAGDFRLFAGCAGFLETFASEKKQEENTVQTGSGLFVLCGSVNPVSAGQLSLAQEHGALRHHLKASDLMSERTVLKEKAEQFLKDAEGYDVAILDTLAEGEIALPDEENYVEVIRRIAEGMGYIGSVLLKESNDKTMMIIGGDTLNGLIRELKVKSLTPREELMPGLVLNTFETNGSVCCLISKSGGFGNRELITELEDILKKRCAK